MRLSIGNPFGGIAPKYDSVILPSNAAGNATDVDLSADNLRLLTCTADTSSTVTHTPVKVAVPNIPTLSIADLFTPASYFSFKLTNGTTTTSDLTLSEYSFTDEGLKLKYTGAYITFPTLSLITTFNGTTTTTLVNLLYYNYWYGTYPGTMYYGQYGSKATIGFNRYVAQVDFSGEIYNSDGVPYVSFDDIFFEDGALGVTFPVFGASTKYVNDSITLLVRCSFFSRYSNFSSYRLTFEDSDGRQGPPSTATALTARRKNQSITLTFNGISVTGDATPSYINIYRADRGTELEKYGHIARVAYGTATYTDYISSPDALGYQLPIYRGVVPPAALYGNKPATMTKVIQTPTMFYVGYYGKVLYFSGLREQNHMFPEYFYITMDYDIVDIVVLGSNVIVLTSYGVYAVWGQQPYEHWTQMITESGCSSANGITIIDDTLYYVSQNGIIRIRDVQEENITKAYFTVEQWRALTPATIRLDTAQEKLFVFCDTVNYMFSFGYNYIRIIKISSETTTFSTTQYIWKSKKFKFEEPVTFKFARVIAETYTGIILNIYRNGSLALTKNITSAKSVILGRLEEAIYWEVEVISNDTINQIDLVQNESEFLIKQ